MTTLTATYCAFCDAVARAFSRMVKTFERIGRARAAAQLASMGYYEEARALMLEEGSK